MKRLLDFVVAFLTLLALALPLLLVAWQIRRKLGSPVLFKQRRPGLHGRPFTMVKFRTMTDARGSDGELLPDEQRLTSFGKFLRSTTLDEFPEMWNVLLGDMSVVGPRPLLMRYVSRYSPFQARRMEVKPGVTGWAQVNGRNLLSWEEKFALDVWYVDRRTFWLDMKIVVMTFFKVFARSGIDAAHGGAVEEFRGELKD